jgi:SNF2 family DNA or RNA helicase
LISLDLPWSTGKSEQRDARIIRISSTWEHVNIMAMLTAGTIEMWIYNMIEEKRGVSAAFLDGGHKGGDFTPSLESLTKFLEDGLAT